ncbi:MULTISPECIES: IS481 family transposase, partial [unclassified Nocardioides]|uniref:IS481 family transposase n=1 Tax=unclassified Nocardioides TaxID=2615069 RepID=UPI0009EFFAED
MSHRNARLNVRGRQLLVERICEKGWAVAHAAEAQGVSRQCAHRWVKRFREEGEAGLHDRSSRPHHCPSQTPVEVEEQILATRREQRRGQDWIAPELGVPARTVSRVLRRHGVPYLRECDPLTGEVIRASKTTTVRYERERPGELVHVDVKKVGKIPEGGGWRAHGRQATAAAKQQRQRIGFDYVHSMVDDHCRLAYSEILPDEKGPTCAGFLLRAATYFATFGIDRIEEVITDNHWSYRHSNDVPAAITTIGAKHRFIKPHCPWQNGKVCEH